VRFLSPVNPLLNNPSNNCDFLKPQMWKFFTGANGISDNESKLLLTQLPRISLSVFCQFTYYMPFNLHQEQKKEIINLRIKPASNSSSPFIYQPL